MTKKHKDIVVPCQKPFGHWKLVGWLVGYSFYCCFDTIQTDWSRQNSLLFSEKCPHLLKAVCVFQRLNHRFDYESYSFEYDFHVSVNWWYEEVKEVFSIHIYDFQFTTQNITLSSVPYTIFPPSSPCLDKSQRQKISFRFINNM